MSYDLGTARGRITLDYEGGREAERAEDDIDRLKRAANDADGEVGRLGRTLAGIGRGVSLGALTVGLTNAAASAAAIAIQLAGIIPQLASIAALSAALPGIYAAILVSTGVLKAAFMGVGEAVKYAFNPEDADKFNEAIEKLAPNAREFAIALRDSAPALKEIQQGIQNAFFENGFTALLPRLVAGLQGLRPVLEGLAFDFGELAHEAASFFLDSDASWEFLESVVVTFREQLAKILPIIEPLLTGIRAVGTVGLDLMDRLGSAVSNTAGRFADWLNAIASDGRLEEWINTAITTLNQLGGIIGNVFSILNSLFAAANDTGGGLLNTLEEITGQFAAFLNSAEGSEAVRALFAGILEIARQLAPVITTLVGALASALAPALAQIATDVGPVLLDVVERLAPAFGPLAAALANLISAIAPILPPLAQLVSLLARGLAVAIEGLAARFGPLIEMLGGALAEAFLQLQPAIAAMAEVLPVAAQSGVELAAALAPLMPVIIELAAAIADSLVAVMPELIAVLNDALPIFAEMAAVMGDQLVQALQIIIPLLPQMVALFAAVLPILVQVLTIGLRLQIWAMQFAAALRNMIGGIIAFGAALVSGLVGGLQRAYDGLVSVGATINEWFRALPGRIMGLLQALPGLLGNLFRNALNAAASAVGYGAGIVVGTILILPGRIMAALRSLPGLLSNFFRNTWNSVRSQAVAAWNSIVNFFRLLPGRIRSALSSLGSILAAIFRNALNNARTQVSNGANNIRNFFAQLPGRIRSALGNLGGLLTGAGRAVINGLINGIQSGIGRVLGMVSNLASRVKNAFNSALDIFSPSRVFFQSGVDIDEGLILGLRKKMDLVRRTAAQLAQSVIAPTVSLPATAARSVGAAVAPVAARTAVEHAMGRAIGNTYQLVLDGKVMAEFVIDTVTGNPRVISKTADEGGRQTSWVGSGRSNNAKK